MVVPMFGEDGTESAESADDAAAVLIKRGFYVGRAVRTLKRTSTTFAIDGKDTKHDVVVNTKGCHAADQRTGEVLRRARA